MFEEAPNKIEDENQLLNTEDKQCSKLSKKNKIMILIIISVLLITIITLIIFFSLREQGKKNKRNEGNNRDEGDKGDDISVLPPLVFNSTSGNHTHSIIFMPGFSNQPENFRNVFINRINFSKKNDTNIIILRSPYINISATKAKNYSWFDVYHFPLDEFSDIDLEQLKKSAKILEKVVNDEVNILNGNYKKIIVGGHSQGSMISLYQAYTTNKSYGGVFAFSGILPPCEIKEEKREMKVYMGYGDKDDVILPSFINKTIEKIMDFEGFDLHIYKNYTHKISTNFTIDVSKFLDNIIK